MLLRILAAAALAGGVALQAADPGLMALVMPDAQVLAGINVEQARATPFGQFLLARIPVDEKGLQSLLDTTGFDPRRDVREVLFAGTGVAGTPFTGGGGYAGGDIGVHRRLLLIRGTFDLPRILAAASAKGVGAQDYQGAKVLAAPQSKGSLAFLDPTLAVAGPAEDVRAALDRRNRPGALSAALATQAELLSTSQDAWLVSIAPIVPAGAVASPDAGPMTGIAQKIQQTSCGVKFGSSAVVSAEATLPTGQDATSLADAIRMLAGMVMIEPHGFFGSSLLQGLTITTDGNVTRATLSIPEARLEQLLRPPELKGGMKRL